MHISKYPNNILLRTKKFAVTIVRLSMTMPRNAACFTITDQIIRSTTSIGANLVEAQEAVSSKEFMYKIQLALKESKETMYWLEIIKEVGIVIPTVIQPLWDESQEITRILVATIKNLRTKV